MCRMASEQPQVSIDLSPFCPTGMTRKLPNGGACCYATYDSGTIQLAPDLVDTPRFTGWGLLVVRVHYIRVLFWSYVCNLFLQRIKLLSVLLGWYLWQVVRMTWFVSIELLFVIKKVPCEKFSRSCQMLLLRRPSMKSYPLQTDVFYVFCIIPGTSQLLSIWCCSHLLPVHEICPSVYLCTLYHHPHGTRWSMSPIIMFVCKNGMTIPL